MLASDPVPTLKSEKSRFGDPSQFTQSFIPRVDRAQDAATLSRIRSPVTSRSNWAKESRTFSENLSASFLGLQVSRAEQPTSGRGRARISSLLGRRSQASRA